MTATFRKLLKPLSWVPFPKLGFALGLLIEGSMFPLMQICIGLMQKFLVNAVEYQDPRYMAYVYGLSVAVLVMVFVINPLGSYAKEQTMKVYTKNLRELTTRKLLNYRYSVYEAYTTGDLVTRMRSNVDRIPLIYSRSIFRLLLGLFYGIGSIALMMTFSWQLSLVVIFLCIIETFAVAKISKKITAENELLQKITSKQTQVLFDIIKSLSLIKVFSIADLMKDRYAQANAESTAKNMDINQVERQLTLLEDFCEAFNLVAILSLGIALYLADRIDLGSVMSFLFLQDGITYMIGNLRTFFSGISAQVAHYDRVQEMLSLEEEYLGGSSAVSLASDCIYVENLSFSYATSQQAVLSGINLTIPQGQITVLSGASGSGKSTLIKMLLGLYEPDAGRICIGKTDYQQLSVSQIRDYYSYVEQSVYLFHDTLEANIRCNNTTATMEDVMRAAKLAGAHDFILQKPEGYLTVVEEHGSNFSGGERQRIAIARALLKDAPAFIFDEATSAVDLENEAEIHKYLQELAMKGKPVLLVSHRSNAYPYDKAHIG